MINIETILTIAPGKPFLARAAKPVWLMKIHKLPIYTMTIAQMVISALLEWGRSVGRWTALFFD
jgi:hypothetical protein